MSIENNKDIQYTQARFWKCALQVNSAAYIKYRGQEQKLTEDEYNQQLLQACLEENIKVVGMADHGNVDSVDAVRNLLTQSGIVVFPGFEIASSEKIHFVCLFDEKTTAQQLERILGRLDLLEPEEGVLPTKLSAIQLIEKVTEIGGFIYAAHATQDDGVLKRRMNHVWQHSSLKAAQIPHSLNDLKSVDGDFYRKVFLNKIPDYQREHPMAIINAKDVEAPATLKEKSASCLIKMTQPSFAAFKQAFLDPESRVRLNSDVPENYSSAITRVRLKSGYLDSLDIELSPHLNAVIGGRGTGKSTLLECIRYALELQPFGKKAQKQHDDIIKENLGKEKGWIELTVTSHAQHGRKFTVSRRYGERSVVKDAAGNLSPFGVQDVLPKIEIFGQSEIYDMAQDETGKRHLLSRFLDVNYGQHEERLQFLLTSLADNREAIVRAYEHKADVESDVELLPKLQEQVKQFQLLRIEEKLKIVPQLEIEKQLSSRITGDIESIKLAVDTVADSLPDSAFLSEASIENLPHADLLRQQRLTLEQLKQKSTELHKQFLQVVLAAQQATQSTAKQLDDGIATAELALEKAFKDIPASQGKTGREIGLEYQSLLRKIEQIKPKKITLEQRQRLILEHETKRKLILSELDEVKADRSSALSKVVKRLNKKLVGKLRLTNTVEGNRESLVKFLMDSQLEGVGEKRLSWVGENDFSPARLSSAIREGSAKLQDQPWGIVPSVANALVKIPLARLLELEELALADTIKMELNVAHAAGEENYRELNKLSTGQQCTAILHLLLLDNKDPLILDQPEDNLDNAFIADRIVSELRRAKLGRQFLFATHNANIPVFGDAEWIGVLNVVDGKGEIPIEQQGAIDQIEIQKLAANILEGGKSAFNQRREKYGFE